MSSSTPPPSPSSPRLRRAGTKHLRRRNRQDTAGLSDVQFFRIFDGVLAIAERRGKRKSNNRYVCQYASPCHTLSTM